MKFNRTPWLKNSESGWSNRREAAAKRAVEREIGKIEEAKRRDAESVALFPELRDPSIQAAAPRFTDTGQRREQLHSRETRMIVNIRADRAKNWRSARALYFAVRDPRRREGIRRIWDAEIYPMDPAYLATIVGMFTRPGTSPWTYLRKKHLCTCWARGSMAKPAHFLEITRNFKSI